MTEIVTNLHCIIYRNSRTFPYTFVYSRHSLPPKMSEYIRKNSDQDKFATEKDKLEEYEKIRCLNLMGDVRMCYCKCTMYDNIATK